MRPHPQRLGDGVFVIDTEHVRAEADASYLIVDGGRAAFVDTGTHRSVPNLLAALGVLDIDVERVDYVLLTHVHLDHAGGAGALMAALPRARVVVHPRGAPHLTDPAKLVAATKAVYREAVFAEQFGDAVAIPAERITTVADGERLAFGARTLEFLHTPGHALHHVCILERDSHELFTGDTFGISYRDFDTAAGPFIFTAATPSQFDPGQLRASVARLAALAPRCAYSDALWARRLRRQARSGSRRGHRGSRTHCARICRNQRSPRAHRARGVRASVPPIAGARLCRR